MDTPSDEARFAAVLAASAMRVPPEQLPALHEGYRHVLRLVGLLGAPATLDAEPAVVFAPDRR
jgi:hypothetical protein